MTTFTAGKSCNASWMPYKNPKTSKTSIDATAMPFVLLRLPLLNFSSQKEIIFPNNRMGWGSRAGSPNRASSRKPPASGIRKPECVVIKSWIMLLFWRNRGGHPSGGHLPFFPVRTTGNERVTARENYWRRGSGYHASREDRILIAKPYRFSAESKKNDTNKSYCYIKKTF